MFDCKVLHTLGKFSLIQWKVEGDLQQLDGQDGQDGQQGFFVSQLVVDQGWSIILQQSCVWSFWSTTDQCATLMRRLIWLKIYFLADQGVGFHLLCPHLQSSPMVCQFTDMADADAGVDTVSGDDAALAVADADAGVLPWFSGFST